VRRFAFRPTLTFRGRTFKGLRGWSVHPPLTDFPIVAYVRAAVFDVLSLVGGEERSWAQEFWHANGRDPEPGPVVGSGKVIRDATSAPAIKLAAPAKPHPAEDPRLVIEPPSEGQHAQ